MVGVARLQWRRVNGAGGAYAPRRKQRGGAERWRGNLLRHEIYKNSVSSVKAEMGMEKQIMCIEQCAFYMSSVVFLGHHNATKSLAAGALPQTPLGEFTALPKPLAEFKGPTSSPVLLREVERKRGEERGAPK